MVYPSNVLHLATESSNKNHSATFPVALPLWFIKLFTREGDLILDPFLGSGTTPVAAGLVGRNSIGIEILENNINISLERFKKELNREQGDLIQLNQPSDPKDIISNDQLILI